MEQDRADFRKISLNANLINEIEHYIEKLGTYKSIAEFVNESIRLRLQQLRRVSGDDRRAREEV